MHTITQFRSFDRPVQLLLINQFSINVGFYMLIPYLPGYLAGDLGLAVWVVGLVLGVRNLTQQGMFFIGGTLADRLGYKPLIVAGFVLRTAGFGLLGLGDSVPALIAATAAIGFAGALFNPAVRAYLTHDAGDRRVDAFPLFNIFYQVGILLGPLLGLALTAPSRWTPSSHSPTTAWWPRTTASTTPSAGSGSCSGTCSPAPRWT